MRPSRILRVIRTNPDPPGTPGRVFEFPQQLIENLGKISAIAPGPSLYRYKQPNEQKLLTTMEYASRILNGHLTTEHRLLGRIDYQVAGDRLEIYVPYFAPDSFVPSNAEVLGLSTVLTALAQQQDASLQVALKLHRVRQTQLDAKILAQVVARNIEREQSPSKTLRDLADLIQTVRPDATIDPSATSDTLPAFIVGWHAYVKGPIERSSLMSANWKASGGTIHRGDARRGIMMDQGRHVTVMRPKGPFMTRITLFVKRWRDSGEWRNTSDLRNRHIGNDWCVLERVTMSWSRNLIEPSDMLP